MANLKAVISKNVGTALTAAYTNTTGQDAALKAFNVNHIGDASAIFNKTPSGLSYGFLGNSVPFMEIDANGTGMSYAIKLSDNKLLLLTNVLYLYNNSNSFLEAQVVEWDGTKYINYPTTRLNITSNNSLASAGDAGLAINGVALSSSKVAFVYVGTLYTATVTNNIVDANVQSLSVTSVFNSTSIKIQPVPNNTDKVVLYGLNPATTSYVLQAYNVPTGVTPTAAGSTQTVMAGSGGMAFDFCLHRRTDPVYFCAGSTNSTSFSGSILSFNDSTNAWTVEAATASIRTSGVSSNTPLITVPLSTDGSASYNTVVVTGDTGGSLLRAYGQTSGTSISTTQTSTIATTNNITNAGEALYYYNLGSRKAIVGSTANGLYGISDSGTLVSLMPSANQDTDRMNLILPFSDRPLYFYNSSSSENANLMGRTGLTATDFGTFTTTGNYIAYGHPNGKSYVWSDTANCWFAVQGQTLYAVSVTGQVLAERNLNINSSTNDKQTIKVINIYRDGTLAMLSDCYGVATNANPNYYVTAEISSTHAFCRFTLVQNATSPAALSTATVTSTLFTANASPRKAADLVLYIDVPNGATTLRYGAVGHVSSGGTPAYIYSTGTVSAPGTVTASTAFLSGSYFPNAYYTNGQLHITRGETAGASTLGIHIGSRFNSTPNITGTLSYTTTPVALLSATGITTQTPLGTSTTEGYIPCVSRRQLGMKSVFGGTNTTNSLYLWTSNNDNAVASVYQISSMTNALKPYCLSSFGLTAITNGASETVAITPFVQYWGLASTAPVVTLNATSSTRSSVNLTMSPDAYSISAVGFGVNATYEAYGAQNTTFTMAINNGTDDFYVTPVTGSQILIGNQYRSTDVYYVPAGGSVKIQAGFNRQIDAMLEVLEQ